MFETGVRQFRMAMAMVGGRRINPRVIERLTAMVQFRAAVAAEKARIPAGPTTAVPQVRVGQPSA